MMKQLIFGLIMVWFPGMYVLQAQHLEKVWETSAGLKTPESVLYDEVRDVIYVANINGNPSEKDGNGFISRLNRDGSEKDLLWVSNLDAPKGMAVFNGMLYVADIDRLIEIDIESGRVLSRYHAPRAEFLNDVAACRNGMIFVSDSRASGIYVLKEGRLTVWLEGAPFENPNGLYTEDGKLYVGDNNIYEVDVSTKAVTELISDAGGVDGLDKNNQGEFVFSHWAGRVFIHREGKVIKLLDSTEKKINSADIDFAGKPDLVLVPTFFDNRVVAYRIVE
jgi:DNA-binding beta-propeller fold protein YncE